MGLRVSRRFSLPITACHEGDIDGDGEITIDEVLAAVNNALNDCT
jgi:hypothetical protein